MPLIKVWNHDRCIRKLVKVKDLQGLLEEGRKKLGYQSTHLKACLEVDGTEIDDNEIFQELFSETDKSEVLMILPCDLKWTPSYEQQVQSDLSASENISFPMASTPMNSSPSESVLIHTSPTISCISCDDTEKNDSISFSIPWNKLPPKFMKACEEKKRPTKRQRNSAVNIICNEILSYQERPTRKFLEKVAENVVKRYPASLKSIIGKEHEYFFCQLENRINNECRMKNKTSLKKQLTMESSEYVNKLKITDSYGCAQWQPEIPENETEETLQEVQNYLKEQYSISSEDELEITCCMERSFCLQRLNINSNCSIREIKEEWPYLQHTKYLILHANKLLGIDLYETWKKALNEKLPKFYSAVRANCHKNSKLKDHLQELQEAVLHHHSRKPEEASFCESVMYSFNEDPLTLFQYFEPTSSVADIQSKLDTSPVVAILGSSQFSDPEGYIFVDREKLGEREKLSSLVILLFAVFYIFNLQYPAGASLTMEFLQRVFYKINPSNRRSLKCQKRARTTVNIKVMNFVNFLQEQDSVWSL